MIIKDTLNGHQALWLENETLKVAVLPSKGADIAEFIHKGSGIQFLMKTPSGLLPPGQRVPADFLENYEGAWQVLFPNANDACVYRGREIPFHGEVALLPWDDRTLQDEENSGEILLTVRCRQTPFRLERRMRLAPGSARLELHERVTNEGEEPWEFVWGQHLTLGGQFLENGCRLHVPARFLLTPDTIFEPATARLAPGQNSPWPMALGRKSGEVFDLQEIPGPEAHSHDDVFIGGLERGEYSVTNPRLGLRFTLEWDASVFPWVILWMPYGGADLPPLTGIYGVGIEPWVSRFPLAQAVQAGQALSLAPGQSLETTLAATIESI
jgi:galactose mutarotase-like enzyme